MNCLKLIIVLTLLFPCLFSCSQTNKVVRKAYAYRAERIAGNVPVDDEGNQIRSFRDTVFFIYVETAKGEIEWTDATMNGMNYSIGPLVIAERPVSIGKEKSSGKPITLQTGEDTVIWKLDLSSTGPSTNGKEKSSNIELHGKAMGKNFTYTVKAPVEIALPDSY